MNCERVEELLSAYLDNALASEEWQEVIAHLQTCTNCSAMLIEFSRNDALISHLPRVSPDPALRNRIFSSPEFLELTGTFDISSEAQQDWTVPKLPAKSPRRDTPGRPQLVAIPGGRSTTPTPSIQPLPPRRSRNSRTLRTLFVVLAATIILAIGIGSMLAFVADPSGTGQARLYIYSTETGITQIVPLSAKGSIAHPIWSPDGKRVAFELVDNGSVSIFDYNTENHGLLTITNSLDSRAGDTVLSLNWSPSLDEPAITWSVGVIGHVHSLWVRRVGVV